MSKEERDKFDKENDLPSSDEVWDEFLNPENKTKNKDAWSDFSKEEPEEVIIDDIGASKSKSKSNESNQEEEKAKKSPYEPNPFGEGGIYYEKNSLPLTWIGGDRNYKLVEKVQKNNKDTNTWYYPVTKTFLACKITRFIIHRNILEFLDLPEKYTIEFEGKECGKFTLKQKTLSQIVSYLKNTVALTDTGIDTAIIAMKMAFKKKGLLEENDETDLTGFLVPNQNSKQIKAPNTDISGTTKEELQTALEYINELAKVGFSDRLDLLAHNIKFAVIAPCAFIFKVIKAPLLRWMCLYGRPNASKSTSGYIILAVDGHHDDTDYDVGGSSVDNMARLAEAIRYTSFPKMLDELDWINDKWLPHNVKISVDDVIIRTVLDRYRNKEEIPGIAACITTSNPSPPLRNGAIMKRMDSRYFSDNEVYGTDEESLKECKIYDDTLLGLSKLAALGRFRNRFIMEHQDIILDKKLSAFDKSKIILIAAHEWVDRLAPGWLIKGQLTQTQLQESIVDVKELICNAIKNMILDKFKYANKIDDLQNYKTWSIKFIQLMNWGVIPFARFTENEDIILNSGFVKELYEYGLTKDELPNLTALGDSIGGRSKRERTGKNIVFITQEQLYEYFEENTEKLQE